MLHKTADYRSSIENDTRVTKLQKSELRKTDISIDCMEIYACFFDKTYFCSLCVF